MINDFWQANFWGILGSTTGIAGLVVSWLVYQYNTPKIEIANIVLIRPNPEWIKEHLAKKSKDFLKGRYIHYEIDILVRNRRGGSGSIDKPTLLIKIPIKKILSYFQLYDTVVVSPKTEEIVSERINSIMSKSHTVRRGYAFNLLGGQSIDGRLEYIIENPEALEEIIENYDSLKYYIGYSNNFGEPYIKKIRKIILENEIH